MRRCILCTTVLSVLTGCGGASPPNTGSVLPPAYPDTWGPHETYVVAAPDNIELRADVYYPIPADRLNGATIVTIHGGGWSSGTRANVTGWEGSMRKAGYTVVSIEYRLTTQGVHFVQQVADCREALLWTQRYAASRGLDPERIGVMGTSAGGHLSAMVSICPSKPAGSWANETRLVRPKCAIAISGAFDVRGDFAAPFPAVQAMIGPPELAEEASPVTWLDPSDPPLLIIHGDSEREPITPLSQAEAMWAAMQERGADGEFVVVKQGDHGLFPHPQFEDTWPTQVEVGKLLVAFMNRYLAPQ